VLAVVADPEAAITALIARRLLTAEERGGLPHLELTHDVLTPLVVRRLIRVQIPLSILVCIFAPLLLLPFAESYRAQGVEVARIIAIAGVFRAMMLFYETVARLQGNGPRLLFVQVFHMIVLVILCFVLSGPWGVNGIAAAWLIAAAATALAVGPWLIGFIRNPEVRVADGSPEALERLARDEFLDAESKSPSR